MIGTHNPAFLAFAAGAGILAGILHTLWTTWRIIFRFYRQNTGAAKRNPGHSGLRWEEIVAPPSRNGASPTLAWFVPASTADVVPAVLLMHGWRTTASVWMPLTGLLHSAGYSVLIPHGRAVDTRGKVGFVTLGETMDDVANSLAWLEAQTNVNQSAIALIGHSLGAVAVMAVAAKTTRVAAVVAMACYVRARAPIEAGVRAMDVKFFPAGWLATRWAEYTRHFTYADADAGRSSAAVACPLLLINGTDDPMVPLQDAKSICMTHGANRAELFVIDKAKHDIARRTDDYWPTLLGFLRSALRP